MSESAVETSGKQPLPIRYFKYRVMPFELTNAPAIFQDLINDVLQDMLNKILFSTLHVRLVLRCLLENNLFVKDKTCEFHVTPTSFLIFIIQQSQLSPDPAKIQAMVNWPTPTNRKELQQFLGFAKFYRCFIQNYNRVVAPVTDYHTLPLTWTERA